MDWHIPLFVFCLLIFYQGNAITGNELSPTKNLFSNYDSAETFSRSFLNHVSATNLFGGKDKQELERILDRLVSIIEAATYKRSPSVGEIRAITIGFATSLAKLITTKSSGENDVERRTEAVINSVETASREATGEIDRELVKQIQLLVKFFNSESPPTELKPEEFPEKPSQNLDSSFYETMKKKFPLISKDVSKSNSLNPSDQSQNSFINLGMALSKQLSSSNTKYRKENSQESAMTPYSNSEYESTSMHYGDSSDRKHELSGKNLSKNSNLGYRRMGQKASKISAKNMESLGDPAEVSESENSKEKKKLAAPEGTNKQLEELEYEISKIMREDPNLKYISYGRNIGKHQPFDLLDSMSPVPSGTGNSNHLNKEIQHVENKSKDTDLVNIPNGIQANQRKLDNMNIQYIHDASNIEEESGRTKIVTDNVPKASESDKIKDEIYRNIAEDPNLKYILMGRDSNRLGSGNTNLLASPAFTYTSDSNKNNYEISNDEFLKNPTLAYIMEGIRASRRKPRSVDATETPASTTENHEFDEKRVPNPSLGHASMEKNPDNHISMGLLGAPDPAYLNNESLDGSTSFKNGNINSEEITKHIMSDPNLKYILLGKKMGNMNAENLERLENTDSLPGKDLNQRKDKITGDDKLENLELVNIIKGIKASRRKHDKLDNLDAFTLTKEMEEKPHDQPDEIFQNIMDDPNLKYILKGIDSGRSKSNNMNLLKAPAPTDLSASSDAENKSKDTSINHLSGNSDIGIAKPGKNGNNNTHMDVGLLKAPAPSFSSNEADELKYEISNILSEDPDLKYLLLGREVGNLNEDGIHNSVSPAVTVGSELNDDQQNQDLDYIMKGINAGKRKQSNMNLSAENSPDNQELTNILNGIRSSRGNSRAMNLLKEPAPLNLSKEADEKETKENRQLGHASKEKEPNLRNQNMDLLEAPAPSDLSYDLHGNKSPQDTNNTPDNLELEISKHIMGDPDLKYILLGTEVGKLTPMSEDYSTHESESSENSDLTYVNNGILTGRENSRGMNLSEAPAPSNLSNESDEKETEENLELGHVSEEKESRHTNQNNMDLLEATAPSDINYDLEENSSPHDASTMLNNQELEIYKHTMEDPDLKYLLFGRDVGKLSPMDLENLAVRSSYDEKKFSLKNHQMSEEKMSDNSDLDYIMSGIQASRGNPSEGGLLQEPSSSDLSNEVNEKETNENPELGYISEGKKLEYTDQNNMDLLGAPAPLDLSQESDEIQQSTSQSDINNDSLEIEHDISKSLSEDPGLKYILLGKNIGNINPEDLEALTESTQRIIKDSSPTRNKTDIKDYSDNSNLSYILKGIDASRRKQSNATFFRTSKEENDSNKAEDETHLEEKDNKSGDSPDEISEIIMEDPNLKYILMGRDSGRKIANNVDLLEAASPTYATSSEEKNLKTFENKAEGNSNLGIAMTEEETDKSKPKSKDLLRAAAPSNVNNVQSGKNNESNEMEQEIYQDMIGDPDLKYILLGKNIGKFKPSNSEILPYPVDNNKNKFVQTENQISNYDTSENPELSYIIPGIKANRRNPRNKDSMQYPSPIYFSNEPNKQEEITNGASNSNSSDDLKYEIIQNMIEDPSLKYILMGKGTEDNLSPNDMEFLVDPKHDKKLNPIINNRKSDDNLKDSNLEYIIKGLEASKGKQSDTGMLQINDQPPFGSKADEIDPFSDDISKHILEDPSLRYILMGRDAVNSRPNNVNFLESPASQYKINSLQNSDKLSEHDGLGNSDLGYITSTKDALGNRPISIGLLGAPAPSNINTESEKQKYKTSSKNKNNKEDLIQHEVSKNVINDPDLKYILLGENARNIQPESSEILSIPFIKANNFIQSRNDIAGDEKVLDPELAYIIKGIEESRGKQNKEDFFKPNYSIQIGRNSEEIKSNTGVTDKRENSYKISDKMEDPNLKYILMGRDTGKFLTNNMDFLGAPSPLHSSDLQPKNHKMNKNNISKDPDIGYIIVENDAGKDNPMKENLLKDPQEYLVNKSDGIEQKVTNDNIKDPNLKLILLGRDIGNLQPENLNILTGISPTNSKELSESEYEVPNHEKFINPDLTYIVKGLETSKNNQRNINFLEPTESHIYGKRSGDEDSISDETDSSTKSNEIFNSVSADPNLKYILMGKNFESFLPENMDIFIAPPISNTRNSQQNTGALSGNNILENQKLGYSMNEKESPKNLPQHMGLLGAPAPSDLSNEIDMEKKQETPGFLTEDPNLKYILLGRNIEQLIPEQLYFSLSNEPGKGKNAIESENNISPNENLKNNGIDYIMRGIEANRNPQSDKDNDKSNIQQNKLYESIREDPNLKYILMGRDAESLVPSNTDLLSAPPPPSETINPDQGQDKMNGNYFENIYFSDMMRNKNPPQINSDNVDLSAPSDSNNKYVLMDRDSGKGWPYKMNLEETYDPMSGTVVNPDLEFITLGNQASRFLPRNQGNLEKSAPREISPHLYDTKKDFSNKDQREKGEINVRPKNSQENTDLGFILMGNQLSRQMPRNMDNSVKPASSDVSNRHDEINQRPDLIIMGNQASEFMPNNMGDLEESAPSDLIKNSQEIQGKSSIKDDIATTQSSEISQNSDEKKWKNENNSSKKNGYLDLLRTFSSGPELSNLGLSDEQIQFLMPFLDDDNLLGAPAPNNLNLTTRKHDHKPRIEIDEDIIIYVDGEPIGSKEIVEYLNDDGSLENYLDFDPYEQLLKATEPIFEDYKSSSKSPMSSVSSSSSSKTSVTSSAIGSSNNDISTLSAATSETTTTGSSPLTSLSKSSLSSINTETDSSKGTSKITSNATPTGKASSNTTPVSSVTRTSLSMSTSSSGTSSSEMKSTTATAATSPTYSSTVRSTTNSGSTVSFMSSGGSSLSNSVTESASTPSTSFSPLTTPISTLSPTSSVSSSSSDMKSTFVSSRSSGDSFLSSTLASSTRTPVNTATGSTLSSPSSKDSSVSATIITSSKEGVSKTTSATTLANEDRSKSTPSSSAKESASTSSVISSPLTTSMGETSSETNISSSSLTSSTALSSTNPRSTVSSSSSLGNSKNSVSTASGVSSSSATSESAATTTSITKTTPISSSIGSSIKTSSETNSNKAITISTSVTTAISKTDSNSTQSSSATETSLSMSTSETSSSATDSEKTTKMTTPIYSSPASTSMYTSSAGLSVSSISSGSSSTKMISTNSDVSSSEITSTSPVTTPASKGTEASTISPSSNNTSVSMNSEITFSRGTLQTTTATSLVSTPSSVSISSSPATQRSVSMNSETSENSNESSSVTITPMTLTNTDSPTSPQSTTSAASVSSFTPELSTSTKHHPKIEIVENINIFINGKKVGGTHEDNDYSIDSESNEDSEDGDDVEKSTTQELLNSSQKQFYSQSITKSPFPNTDLTSSKTDYTSTTQISSVSDSSFTSSSSDKPYDDDEFNIGTGIKINDERNSDKNLREDSPFHIIVLPDEAKSFENYLRLGEPMESPLLDLISSSPKSNIDLEEQSLTYTLNPSDIRDYYDIIEIDDDDIPDYELIKGLSDFFQTLMENLYKMDQTKGEKFYDDKYEQYTKPNNNDNDEDFMKKLLPEEILEETLLGAPSPDHFNKIEKQLPIGDARLNSMEENNFAPLEYDLQGKFTESNQNMDTLQGQNSFPNYGDWSPYQMNYGQYYENTNSQNKFPGMYSYKFRPKLQNGQRQFNSPYYDQTLGFYDNSENGQGYFPRYLPYNRPFIGSYPYPININPNGYDVPSYQYGNERNPYIDYDMYSEPLYDYQFYYPYLATGQIPLKISPQSNNNQTQNLNGEFLTDSAPNDEKMYYPNQGIDKDFAGLREDYPYSKMRYFYPYHQTGYQSLNIPEFGPGNDLIVNPESYDYSMIDPIQKVSTYLDYILDARGYNSDLQNTEKNHQTTEKDIPDIGRAIPISNDANNENDLMAPAPMDTSSKNYPLQYETEDYLFPFSPPSESNNEKDTFHTYNRIEHIPEQSLRRISQIMNFMKNAINPNTSIFDTYYFFDNLSNMLKSMENSNNNTCYNRYILLLESLLAATEFMNGAYNNSSPRTPDDHKINYFYNTLGPEFLDGKCYA